MKKTGTRNRERTMRILKIRFKNLNSLVGQWEIDLTHRAYASDGIFAITGPTGAGKTTILDAVCLALYGRTPRLTKVTKAANEIMSRQTGECFAEVTFETQVGRFRCHWSQHRARKKPDGELQPPRHEIADADSGKIFEEKLRGVAEQIETATGMDFDRFTRSMLLAQGGFAAFLQAAPDERAPILEQITGTEIYSEISVRVHERRSEERKKLEILLAELAGMQILGEEDERRLTSDLERMSLEEADLARRIVQTNQAVAWLTGMERLERELQLVSEQQKGLQARKEEFVPDGQRLGRAMKALEAAGEHAALASVRREQEADVRSHGEWLNALPGREEQVKRAEAAMKQAGERLAGKKAEQKEAAVVIRKTRELDLTLREKEAPIRAAADAVSERETALAALRSGHEADSALLVEKKSGFDEVVQRLAESAADEGLVEHLAGIRGRFDTLGNLHAQRTAKAEEVKAAEQKAAEADRRGNERAADLLTRKTDFDSLQNALTQKKSELEKTLDGFDPADRRNRVTVLKERKLLLHKVVEADAALTESNQSFAELNGRHDVLNAKKSEVAEQLRSRMEKHASQERETNLLEEKVSLLRRIQSLEEARRRLEDGTPCPLCGAVDHPYAQGNVPAPDEAAAALAAARADLKAAAEAVAGLRIEQAEVDKDLEQLALRKQECTDKIAASAALVGRGCAELSIEVSPDLSTLLSRLLKENGDTLDRETKIVQAAETMEKELATLRESVEKAKDAVVLAERAVQDAAHAKDSAHQAFERGAREAATLDVQHGKEMSEAQQAVSAYGVGELSMDVLDSVRHTLTGRRERWISRRKERSELERQIVALDTKTEQQKEQISKTDSELNVRRDLLDGLLRERETIRRERGELFGDKNPDTEEARLAEAVAGAEGGVEASRLEVDDATRELGKLKNSLEVLARSMAERAGQLKAAEETFLIRLNELGFSDEAGYVAARLPEEEREQLQRLARELEREQTELASMEREKQFRSKTEREKNVTDRPREELDREAEDLVAGQKELQQGIGGIRQKLKDNENLKKRQRERAIAVEARKKECSRWDNLHELIGSADGKKYRNFAQGLTFDLMIGHANRQLRKMTDRYLLTREDAQPLELNVVDNYQAGEIRSTKNLSGGESFIVSLSLALGLSRMAGKKVRVDSLFLDEGFGTLDEESLDTALETLARLQQDGKIIGVISHVAALKERIPTQIQIIPRTGGRSVIDGPGCVCL